MKRPKLRSERGETLIEVLASVLIVSLSVMMVAGSVMASSKVDVDAKRLDEAHYAALSRADAHVTPTPTVSPTPTPIPTAQVTIAREGITTTTTVDIQPYGGAGMYSYERAGS